MRNISVRLSDNDLLKLKGIAQRLDVNNSEVIRYAIKTIINKLIVLSGTGAQVDTQALILALIENCNDLNRYFNFDSDKFEKILDYSDSNISIALEKQDIELLSLCGMSDEAIQKRFQRITGIVNNEDITSTQLKEFLINKYCSK
ncbi:MAG: hypothetical protein OEY89_03400 [Gammaproteobacteria bacterium]|nr:hypothetical protein [Gammaproteobacteria bacterium]